MLLGQMKVCPQLKYRSRAYASGLTRAYAVLINEIFV